MAENITSTFGGYSDVTEVIAGATQTSILAELAKLKALIPDPDTAPANRGTDAGGNFDQIAPQLAHQLRGEIDALNDAIDAAPTA